MPCKRNNESSPSGSKIVDRPDQITGDRAKNGFCLPRAGWRRRNAIPDGPEENGTKAEQRKDKKNNSRHISILQIAESLNKDG